MTLALAALRELDTDKQRRLEDRCTELLASLVYLYPEVQTAVLELFDLKIRSGCGVRPQTQAPTGRGQQHVDLQLLERDEVDERLLAWFEVKVWSRESGPSQFHDYLAAAGEKGIEFRVLCHEKHRQTIESRHDGLVVRTWEDLVAVLRGLLELGNRPIKESQVESASSELVRDVSQFILYLQNEKVIEVPSYVNASDLDRFHRWQDALWNVYSLWYEVFDALDEDFPAPWESERIEPKRNSPFNHRRLWPRGDAGNWSEWWWGVWRLDGTETWGIELSLISRPFWLESIAHRPALVWGITQHANDPDLKARLGAVAAEFDELTVVSANGKESRWYGAVSLGEALSLPAEKQADHFVESLGAERLGALRDALADAGFAAGES